MNYEKKRGREIHRAKNREAAGYLDCAGRLVCGIERGRKTSACFTRNDKLRCDEKTEPGRFAEGPRHPGLILPASAVCEQGTRRNFFAPQANARIP